MPRMSSSKRFHVTRHILTKSKICCHKGRIAKSECSCKRLVKQELHNLPGYLSSCQTISLIHVAQSFFFFCALFNISLFSVVCFLWPLYHVPLLNLCLLIIADIYKNSPIKLWLNSLVCWLVASLLSVHREQNVQAYSGLEQAQQYLKTLH